MSFFWHCIGQYCAIIDEVVFYVSFNMSGVEQLLKMKNIIIVSFVLNAFVTVCVSYMDSVRLTALCR